MIYVDASPAVHHKAGLGRYAEDLIGALKTQGTSLTAFYHDAANAKPSPLIKSLPQLATPQTPYPWRLRALLAHLVNLSQDDLLRTTRLRSRDDRRLGREAATTDVHRQPSVVNLFHATEHLLPRFKQTKSVFTLHDLIFKFFPQHHLPRNRIFLSLAMPLFLRRANAIICVSEHTQRDAVKLYQIDEAKTRVIYEGVHPRFKRVNDVQALQRAKERYNLPDQFILAVGTIEPRKNLITLFEAFKELIRRDGPVGRLGLDGPPARLYDDLHIIVVGKQGWLFEETFRTVHERGLTGRIKFPGFVADEDLPAVYSLAKAFAFPSVYEGFGFPPLEAMACGTPVVCSNASSLPELMGQAALLLPPTDAVAWATALNRVLTDRSLVQDLRGRGPHQAAKYSWDRAAKETRRVYEGLLQTS